jgi:hypothetical protein
MVIYTAGYLITNHINGIQMDTLKGSVAIRYPSRMSASAANPDRKHWSLSNLPNMSRSIPCLQNRKSKTPGQVDSQAERWQKQHIESRSSWGIMGRKAGCMAAMS